MSDFIFIHDWIDNQLAVIAKKLPQLVAANPEGYYCGRAHGYKQALLDLIEVLEEKEADVNDNSNQ
jgi:hypothetical protein